MTALNQIKQASKLQRMEASFKPQYVRESLSVSNQFIPDENEYDSNEENELNTPTKYL